ASRLPSSLPRVSASRRRPSRRTCRASQTTATNRTMTPIPRAAATRPPAVESGTWRRLAGRGGREGLGPLPPHGPTKPPAPPPPPPPPPRAEPGRARRAPPKAKSIVGEPVETPVVLEPAATEYDAETGAPASAHGRGLSQAEIDRAAQLEAQLTGQEKA